MPLRAAAVDPNIIAIYNGSNPLRAHRDLFDRTIPRLYIAIIVEPSAAALSGAQNSDFS